MKSKTDWRIVSIAIVAIAVLEIYALSQGINGVLLTTVIGILAGLAGWSLPQLRTR